MQSQWERITYQDSDREKVWAKSRSFAQDVWFRFRRKPTALGGLIIIALLLITYFEPISMVIPQMMGLR